MTRIITGDGTSIACRITGANDAPVLILGNSLGTDMRLFDPQVEALARRFRVVRFDMRGHGRSGAPAGDYSIARLGQDVLDLADALDIERFAFAGVSLGGMVGQWLGVRAAERLRALALCNTSAFMRPPEAWQARIAAVCADGMAAMADAVGERWFTPAFRASHPDVVAHALAMLRATPASGYAGCCAAIRDMDQRGAVRAITVPVLVIAGRDDPATPLPHAGQLVHAIPNARLAVLDAAHLSNLERPAEFTQLLAGFLEDAIR